MFCKQFVVLVAMVDWLPASKINFLNNLKRFKCSIGIKLYLVTWLLFQSHQFYSQNYNMRLKQSAWPIGPQIHKFH